MREKIIPGRANRVQLSQINDPIAREMGPDRTEIHQLFQGGGGRIVFFEITTWP
jgi:hypothetical protein